MKNETATSGTTVGKKPGTGRKILNFIFNFFWAIFGGIARAISCFFSDLASAIRIIPIFFGVPMVYWRLRGLAFAPAGKKVVLNFSAHPVKNIFYYIFGGVAAIIGNYLYGALLCCTIIGIPLGLQHFKFAYYFLAPFGARVYKNGQELVLDKKAAAEKKAKEESEARELQRKSEQEALLKAAAQANKPQRSIEDIAKLKDLLDKGVITQEEFDKSKKEILGL